VGGDIESGDGLEEFRLEAVLRIKAAKSLASKGKRNHEFQVWRRPFLIYVVMRSARLKLKLIFSSSMRR
jgi:hypothetical protein